MIEINVEKHLRDISLNIEMKIKGREFVTIFGKSGSGKTTILKILAGLITPDRGFINVNGQTWFDSERGINLPPQKRNIGFLFQDYALFPNMTVEENILFAMDRKDRRFLDEILSITEIEDIRDRKPETLSGGQKQRVALARALARKPAILLLDEPLSALDLETRIKIQEEIEKIHRSYSLTTVMVSHDYSEIFRLSDRVFVLSDGKIIKEGKPEDVFVQEKISGKVKFNGQIVKIEREDVIYIVSVLIGNSIIKVVAVEEEVKELKVGDSVLIASKAFNPFILKL